MNLEIKVLLETLVISVVCGLITIPILKKLKVGQIERDDGPESHLKKQGTPTMGGIIIMLGIIIVTIIAYIYYSNSDVAIAKSLIPILVPLFISSFRRADELAMAMEARCYRGGEGRTRMKKLAFSLRDFIAFLIYGCIIAVFIYIRIRF